MESRIIRILVALGVPGVALGIFYLLLRGFGFDFSRISPGWSAIVAIMFLLLVASVTTYALHLWRPTSSRSESLQNDTVMQSVSDDDKARLDVANMLYLSPLTKRFRDSRGEADKRCIVAEAINEFSELRKKWRMPQRVFEFYMTVCLEEDRIIHLSEFIDGKRMVTYVKRHREYANDVGTWLAANVAGMDISDS